MTTNKLYQTYAQVHLGNIKANIEGIKKAVGQNRKILIAVKANAYGHGAVEVSRMAESIGVDFLGVATVPEGIELRQAGIKLPILKLSHAFDVEMLEAVKHNITLAVSSLDNAKSLAEICKANGLKACIHLKIDTGMGRIGFKPEDAPSAAAFIKNNYTDIYIEGIFTHLPISDIADKTWTHNQLERFRAVVKDVESSLGRKLDIVHASNSGAVLGHEEAWLDMVRPGIMIYGYYPDDETPKSISLAPGMSIYTRVSFVKDITKDTSIGYGRTWIAPKDSTIATIPIGYADGFNRLFSNKGNVLINGKKYPIVGRVCMDQSMVDIGTNSGIKVGDEVVIMGKSTNPAFKNAEITCYELAKSLGTITYEVTCQINGRVKRYYDDV